MSTRLNPSRFVSNTPNHTPLVEAASDHQPRAKAKNTPQLKIVEQEMVGGK